MNGNRQRNRVDGNANRSAPSLRWLVLGALAGLGAAAYGLLDRAAPDDALPGDAIARVGEVVITRRELERSVDQLEAAYRQQLAAGDRARVLEQLIDEELLVQRGVELGMPTSEATVRAAIVQSMIASVTAEADAADPDDATLQQYLEDHAARYTYASAMTLEGWVTDDERLARQYLAGLDAAEGKAPPDGIRPVPGLPAGPAPLERLRMFVGPAIAAAAADMPVGESAVFARQGRWYIVRVASRDATKLADLDSVRSQVLVDYRRSLAEDRLDDYLDDLRRRTEVTVTLPQ